jgi:hypothetical protein
MTKYEKIVRNAELNEEAAAQYKKLAALYEEMAANRLETAAETRRFAVTLPIEEAERVTEPAREGS